MCTHHTTLGQTIITLGQTIIKVRMARLLVDALSLIAPKRLFGWILQLTESAVISSLAISSSVRDFVSICSLTKRQWMDRSSFTKCTTIAKASPRHDVDNRQLLSFNLLTDTILLVFKYKWHIVMHISTISELISIFFQKLSERLYFAQGYTSLQESSDNFDMIYLAKSLPSGVFHHCVVPTYQQYSSPLPLSPAIFPCSSYVLLIIYDDL